MYKYAIILFIPVAIVLALRLWAYDPEGTEYWVRSICLFVAVGIFLAAYMGYVSRLADEHPSPRFNLRGLFLLVTSASVLSAAGYALDALFFSFFLAYAYFVGPICRRMVSNGHLQKDSPKDTEFVHWTSALIVASFVLFSTIAVAAIVLLIPARDVQQQWVPGSMQLLLYPGALFAWAAIVGDNAQGNQLLLYGLPFGIPFNVLTGFAAGFIFGKLSRKKRIGSRH